MATVRSIAAELGVSPMTVSLALRRHPSIPASTRERVQAAARIQGYRPDPLVGRLMAHLGTHRARRHRANLCALAPAGYVRPQGYMDRLYRALRVRAETLGYAFSLVDIDAFPGPGRLRRHLRGRGVEGIVLTPLPEPRDLSAALPWSEFSVVTVTPSVLQPLFHGISPNHYDNMALVCRELAAAGFRRIGLALPEDRDLRVRHRWSGALARHNLFGGAEPVPPLIDPGGVTSLDPDRLDAWIREHRPDVIVTDVAERQVSEAALRAAASGGLRPRVVAMSWPNPYADAGIDQQVEEIAALAIDRLAGLLQQGERGVPPTPSTTMIEGVWKLSSPGRWKARPGPGRGRAASGRARPA